MPKPWREFTDDEILNSESANTALMARYQRIMEMKTIEALGGVKDKLVGVMQTVYGVSQSLGDRTDKLIDRYDKISKVQGRQQALLLGLTVVIAVCTAIYTWITWQSVDAMREANQIQRQFLELQIQQGKAHGQNG